MLTSYFLMLAALAPDLKLFQISLGLYVRKFANTFSNICRHIFCKLVKETGGSKVSFELTTKIRSWHSPIQMHKARASNMRHDEQRITLINPALAWIIALD